MDSRIRTVTHAFRQFSARRQTRMSVFQVPLRSPCRAATSPLSALRDILDRGATNDRIVAEN
jgi:hypothetical protein